MFRHGCQTVWFLLIATLAAGGTVQAVSEDIAAFRATQEPSLADEAQMAGDDQSAYSLTRRRSGHKT